MTIRTVPDLSVEHELFRTYGLLVSYDEAGRGALAGPVAVGAVALRAGCGPVPAGLADSKQLSARQRAAVRGEVEAWVEAWSVGCASAAEIESYGIMRALRLAGARARAGLGVEVGGGAEAALVDGPYDWVTRPEPVSGEISGPVVPVRCEVRGDARCASLSAASVLAKEHRDAVMDELDLAHPGYGWGRNRGYGSASHRAAIASLGLSPEHRGSWCRV